MHLRGLTMAGGALGNQVKTSLTTNTVLYMLRKFIIPLAATIPATESPGNTAAKLWLANGFGFTEFLRRT